VFSASVGRVWRYINLIITITITITIEAKNDGGGGDATGLLEL